MSRSGKSKHLDLAAGRRRDSAAAAVASDGRQLLREHLLRRGLKPSRQRDIIAKVFVAARGHLRVDELWQRARAHDPRIAQATVYRTMKLLTDCGLAAARHFDDGQVRYERGELDGHHHDHLICQTCGQIVEFVEPRIEALQEQVALSHGFTVTEHKLELYDTCQACRQAGAEHKPRARRLGPQRRGGPRRRADSPAGD